MKGIHFKNKNGETICIAWNSDPLNYPPSENFSEGWTWEEVAEGEGVRLIPQDPATPKKFPDPPAQVVRELKLKHDILIEILEDHLKFKKGDLKVMIDEKLKGGKDL
jgi:hypothetical protein